ncbi:MAG: PDDEXK nuclease domain-containing protein [Chlorobiaceae bacterium]
MSNNAPQEQEVNTLDRQQEFSEVLQQIRQSRQNVFAHINTALIELYWHIGKTISYKVRTAAWGNGVVAELARCKTTEERAYYLKLTATEKLTKRELERQIDAAPFERSMLSTTLSPAARELHPAIGTTFKDSYVLEFLGLPPQHRENNQQKAMVQHMKQFILELGKEFIFMGEEYRLQVGHQDFFIDLLFFHRGLSALVAFELKIGKFMPEYIGQLNFYLEALDRDSKKPHKNPSIGVLLCRDKDDEVVEYALSRNLSPVLIAQYQLQLPDKRVLQAKLHELYANEDELDRETRQGGEV